MQNPGQVRHDLEGLLKMEGVEDAVTDRVWEWLLREGHVERVVSGEKGLDWLADRVTAFHEATATGRVVRGEQKPALIPARRSRASLPGDRTEARSILIAREAARDPGVEWFRKAKLGGNLIEPERVEDWIRRQAEADGPSTLYVRVPLPQDAKIEFRGKTKMVVVPGFPPEPEFWGGFREALAYAVPESKWVRRVAVTHGGTLQSLRGIAESVEKQYAWQAGAGATFILTGQIPVVSRFRPEIKSGVGRVILDVDVADVSPRELARFYGSILKGLRPGRRTRALTLRHVHLAVFAAEREEQPWRERMAAWNRAYPEGKYRQESNFRRDALQAQRRLLAPAFSLGEALDFAAREGTLPGKLEKEDDAEASRPPRKKR